MTPQLFGAGAFGVILGWFVYYINRYRKSDVQFSDLTTLIGIIGGGSITSLFDKGGELFGAYGIGLAIGFFSYFFVLIILVRNSEGEFTWTWFLDGRRKDPKAGFSIPGEPRLQTAMEVPESVTLNAISGLRADLARHLGPGQLAPSLEAGITEVNPSASRIIAACEATWDGNKGDCNQFVIAVAAALGVGGLTPPADAIVSTILGSNDWRELADGVEAKQAADAGDLVIGGLKAADHVPPRTHGHVVIVVSGTLALDKYPTAYWGSLGGQPYKNATTNFAWNRNDRDHVHYAARKLPS